MKFGMEQRTAVIFHHKDPQHRVKLEGDLPMGGRITMAKFFWGGRTGIKGHYFCHQVKSVKCSSFYLKKCFLLAPSCYLTTEVYNTYVYDSALRMSIY